MSEKEKFDHDNGQLLLDQNFAIGVVSICQLIACCLRPFGIYEYDLSQQEDEVE